MITSLDCCTCKSVCLLNQKAVMVNGGNCYNTPILFKRCPQRFFCNCLVKTLTRWRKNYSFPANGREARNDADEEQMLSEDWVFAESGTPIRCWGTPSRCRALRNSFSALHPSWRQIRLGPSLSTPVSPICAHW
ncbi:hypothetical protein KSP39_PZI022270 [Platanthera zijinensis]|uniref:Uncharacterized protein n=1 Tax=Platanthera zijinensis TaxID=2320716 RepID=A0AAP0FVG3_9ASPA